MTDMTSSLPININTFGFVQREKVGGKEVPNRCGRDFFYYALHYYFPDNFAPDKFGPVEIERQGIFGLRVPTWLIWTFLSFRRLPRLLNALELELTINGFPVQGSFLRFVRGVVGVRPPSAKEALLQIRHAIDAGHVVGIDVPVALGGLVNHVMFVYGYQNDSLILFDTHHVEGIGCSKTSDATEQRFILKMTTKELERNWTKLNRVWIVRKVA